MLHCGFNVEKASVLQHFLCTYRYCWVCEISVVFLVFVPAATHVAAPKLHNVILMKTFTILALSLFLLCEELLLKDDWFCKFRVLSQFVVCECCVREEVQHACSFQLFTTTAFKVKYENILVILICQSFPTS